MVGLLGVGLDALGDGAEALGVEDVLGVEILDGTMASAVMETFSSVRPFFFSSSLSVFWMLSANCLRWLWRSMNVWLAATERSASVSLPSMRSPMACSSRLRSPNERAAASTSSWMGSTLM